MVKSLFKNTFLKLVPISLVLVLAFGNLSGLIKINKVSAAAPAVVTNVIPTPGNRSVTITWDTPSSVDFTGTMVRFSTTAFPTSTSDGTLVSDVAGTPSGSGTVTHSSLTNGTVYYYSLFSHNVTPEYSAAVNTQQLAMVLAFSDDFEALSIANIDGQNGWDAIGCSWSVVDTSGDQTLKSTTTSGAYETCRVLNGGTVPTYSNQMLRTEWKGSTTTTPGQIFLRAQSASADAGGYFMWQSGGTVRINYKTTSGSANTQLTSAAFTPTANVWYTYEFSIVNSSAGLPVLTGYVWQRGTSKPSTPTVQVTDTVNRHAQGVFSVGKTSTSAAEYDNVSYFGMIGVSSLNVTPGNAQNTLAWTNPTYATYSGAMIRFSTSSYPATISDGTLVESVTGTSAGSSSSTHSGLTNGTLYYYTIFPYDSSTIYGTPIRKSQEAFPQLFTDNFNSRTLGNIVGQNAWTAVGGSWNVIDSSGNYILEGTSTGTTYPTNKVVNGSAETTNQILFTRFRSDTASNNAGYIWLRHQTSRSGYLLWHNVNTWTISSYDVTGPTLTNLATGTGAAPMEANVWFNMEVSCINNGSGNPVLKIFMWKDGMEKPASPIVEYTDTANLFTKGTFALGRHSSAASVNYDNLTLHGAAPTIDITSPAAGVVAAPDVGTLAISDEGGTFYIPYIQTSTTLTVNVTAGVLQSGEGIEFVLNEDAVGEQTIYDLSSPYSASFADLAKAEYTVDAYVLQSDGVTRYSDAESHDERTDVAIGDIITLIGDSVAEGNGGTIDAGTVTSWLDADSGTVSADNRNFPQHGPGTGTYNEGFLTDLNDKLAAYYGYPVFIMNEGKGGIAASNYQSSVMVSAWQTRQNSLDANKWIIALGINDSRGGASVSTFQTNLTTLINVFINSYGATADNIWVAYPNYDFGTGASGAYSINFTTYSGAYDNVRSNLGLQGGPDLLNVTKYYEATEYNDNVHPNATGYQRLSRLWFLSMIKPTISTPNVMSGNTATIAWNNLASYESTVAGYKINYGKTSSNLNLNTTTTSTGVTISGLEHGNNFYFSVEAYDNNSNYVSYSDDSSTIGPFYADASDVVSSSSTTGGGSSGGSGGSSGSSGDSDDSDDEVSDDTDEEEIARTPFEDIIGHWAEDAIGDLFLRDVLQGRSLNTFEPNEEITRAEFLKIALLNAGFYVNNYEGKTFDDVSSRDWFSPYISFAADQGFVEGYTDGNFRPNDAINRAEALVIIMRVSREIPTELSDEDLAFYDVNLYDWYSYAVLQAQQDEIIEGYEDGSFRPMNAISRAESAVIANRVFEKYYQ
jgi:lysophospholipase L1-like esterase